jgi:hypothetical protein
MIGVYAARAAVKDRAIAAALTKYGAQLRLRLPESRWFRSVRAQLALGSPASTLFG